jgi:hypothetical protein
MESFNQIDYLIKPALTSGKRARYRKGSPLKLQVVRITMQ